jgi:hypothetical protein
MSISTPRHRQAIVPAMIGIFLLLSGIAFPGENSPGSNLPRTRANRTVRLQLRIAEARRKADSIRYFRSVARQQKKGGTGSPSVVLPSKRRIAGESPE